MANAFISGRRYPTGGGAVIPAGSQSYTANGTFTAPYTGVYTVAITAPVAKGGNGANGVDGSPGGSSYYDHAEAPTGGGAGGSAYIAPAPLIILVSLTQGASIPITVNTSVSSFGSYGSFAAGTGGGNGTAGTQDAFDPVAGVGGAGGSKPTPSSAGVLSAITPTLPNITLTGGNGIQADDSGSETLNSYKLYMAVGGTPAVGFGNPGGRGGAGNPIVYAHGDNWSNWYEANCGTGIQNGSAARAGRIDITWGNQ